MSFTTFAAHGYVCLRCDYPPRMQSSFSGSYRRGRRVTDGHQGSVGRVEPAQGEGRLGNLPTCPVLTESGGATNHSRGYRTAQPGHPSESYCRFPVRLSFRAAAGPVRRLPALSV
jgi:hypothetical protein